MHLAYIISAYKNLGQVERLVRLLTEGGETVMTHVDKKTSDREFSSLVAALSDLAPARFVPRHTCHYGGFGHVEATLKGIADLALIGDPFDYVVLLTGQDYPIKPLSEVRAFLAGSDGRSFMGHHLLPSPHWSPRGGLDRVEYRHLRLYGQHVRLPGKRSFPARLRPYGGGAYWCLSRACIEYVRTFVAERPDVVRFFRRVDIPDELFFQTIIMNSDLAATVVNDNLRYIDWSRGARPAVLGMADLAALRSSSKLFARKFDVSEDASVLDAIDRELLARDA